MSVGNVLTGQQGKRRAPTRRAAKSGPSSKLLASRAMSQRSGPGFRNRANEQRVELGPAEKDAGIESSTLGA
jgi:hypothetical protein